MYKSNLLESYIYSAQIHELIEFVFRLAIKCQRQASRWQLIRMKELT